MDRLSIIVPGRCEEYFQQTVDDILLKATGDIEVIPVIDGYIPDPPLNFSDPRVKPIFLEESIGQRAAYNLGVRNSTGKYIMKLDAHAMVCEGFDEILKSHCPPKTTVVPEMRRLDPHKWEVKPRGRTHFMHFGLDVYCHFWQDYRKRPEAKGDYPEIMNGQGSCWFCEREWNDHIGLLDERVGSWGKVGIEVAMRTWLCGGTHIVNKKAWQAHWFRRDDGGFTYPMDGRKVAKARDFVKNNYFFKDNAFKNQVRPFKWLIQKFAPVPGWEIYLQDEYKTPRTVIYYTDHRIEQTLARVVIKQLQKSAMYIPIVSVSQKPMNLGNNICVGEKPRCNRSILEQILVGLEKAPKGSIIYLVEHDVIYHTSHFAKIPNQKNALYYNRSRFHWQPMLPNYLPSLGDRALSQLVCYREYLMDTIKEWLSTSDDPTISTRFPARFFDFKSDKPNIDIRHGDNFTRSGHRKGRYSRGKQKGLVDNLPGWGSPKHMAKKISYKGTQRTDIINELISVNNYKSYLEIGIRNPKDNFDRININHKDGVDPNGKCKYVMTSDEFFKINQQRYDIIFIDGLHEAKQVEKDIYHSFECLNPDGIVVMHDCNPANEKQQQIPRGKQKTWCGDVWKAFVKYRSLPNLEMYIVDTNNGVGVLRRGCQEPLEIDDFSYKQLDLNRKKWLNLVSIAGFRKHEKIKGERCTAIV